MTCGEENQKKRKAYVQHAKLQRDAAVMQRSRFLQPDSVTHTVPDAEVDMATHLMHKLLITSLKQKEHVV